LSQLDVALFFFVLPSPLRSPVSFLDQHMVLWIAFDHILGSFELFFGVSVLVVVDLWSESAQDISFNPVEDVTEHGHWQGGDIWAPNDERYDSVHPWQPLEQLPKEGEEKCKVCQHIGYAAMKRLHIHLCQRTWLHNRTYLWIQSLKNVCEELFGRVLHTRSFDLEQAA
jgi:hypothetical protein